MKVFLLGAGASKSFADSSTGLRMPIANDFFRVYSQSSLSENKWVLVGKLLNYLQDFKGVQDWGEWFAKGNDLEEIFSEVATKIDDNHEDHFEKIRFASVYNELVFLFACVVNHIANGPVSTPHLDIAQILEQGDVVITFNWDTLMDRALLECNKLSFSNGYGLEPHSVFADGWNLPLSNLKSPITLLKLHGSANWLTGYPYYKDGRLVSKQGVPDSTLFIFENATKPYPTYAGRYMGNYSPLTFGYYPPNFTHIEGKKSPKDHIILQVRQKFHLMPESNSDSSGFESIPLIIPPEKNKKYSFYGDLFNQLWTQAQGALEGCDELIVIGYSFPKTDTRSLDLFKNAFLKRSRIPKVAVIDPSPERPADVFRFNLGIPSEKLSVIKECFEGKSTLDKIE